MHAGDKAADLRYQAGRRRFSSSKTAPPRWFRGGAFVQTSLPS